MKPQDKFEIPRRAMQKLRNTQKRMMAVAKLLFFALCAASVFAVAQSQSTYVPPDPDPAKIDAAHFTVGYEDGHIRVLHFSLPPGEVTPMFEQMEHVVAVVCPARLILTAENGAIRELQTATGQAIHGGREKLSLRNIGNVTFEAVITEFKDGAAAVPSASNSAGR